MKKSNFNKKNIEIEKKLIKQVIENRNNETINTDTKHEISSDVESDLNKEDFTEFFYKQKLTIREKKKYFIVEDAKIMKKEFPRENSFSSYEKVIYYYNNFFLYYKFEKTSPNLFHFLKYLEKNNMFVIINIIKYDNCLRIKIYSSKRQKLYNDLSRLHFKGYELIKISRITNKEF